MSEWQPIETAPEGKAVFGYRTQFSEWYYQTFECSREPKKYGYTHWMIPNPPVDTEPPTGE